MAVTIFEGRQLSDEGALLNQRQERRFRELAAAVREHEANRRRAGRRLTAQDDALYRRLRQLCGDF